MIVSDCGVVWVCLLLDVGTDNAWAQVHRSAWMALAVRYALFLAVLAAATLQGPVVSWIKDVVEHQACSSWACTRVTVNAANEWQQTYPTRMDRTWLATGPLAEWVFQMKKTCLVTCWR